jgi:hypothetical protein
VPCQLFFSSKLLRCAAYLAECVLRQLRLEEEVNSDLARDNAIAFGICLLEEYGEESFLLSSEVR